jgi:hypothetical protein
MATKKKTAKTTTPKATKGRKATKAPAEAPTPAVETTATAEAAAPATKRTKKAKAPNAKPERMSMLDAAAKVLAGAAAPMTCQALIEAMAAQGLWTSPKGKTPAATLSAALHREIKVKAKDSRFRKADRGHFALAPTV